VIKARLAEFQSKKETGFSSVLPTQTANEEQDDFGECCYLSKKRRHLAFLDVLIEASENDPSLTLSGIQEEVDSFMFAVGLIKILHHFIECVLCRILA
jgi:hypothetical protein